jgi:uncharacterized membrane protein YraQ (UPF0718 family)
MRVRVGSMEVLVLGLVAFAFSGVWLRATVARNDMLATAGTVFCGVFVQAVPFLGLGVLVSGLIAVFVPPERLVRWLPRRATSAILAAGVAGAALPGCECGSVPVARRLFGDGGVAGAAAALHVLVPPQVFEHVGAHLILGVTVMAALAVTLAVCSEADAFVASSLTMVPLVPRLVFLVVGPAVDVKLLAMQSGMFGRAFAARFAPATLVVATVIATAVGVLLLGGSL